jgi:hypothetical protein
MDFRAVMTVPDNKFVGSNEKCRDVAFHCLLEAATNQWFSHALLYTSQPKMLIDQRV